MRHFRSRRGFRRKRPTQWVASNATWGTVGTANAAGGVVNAEICGATGTGTGFDPPIIQRFTVLTIHGDIQLWQSGAGAAGTVALIHMGIAVSTLSGAGAPVNLDPSLPAHAGIPWIWIAHFQIAETVAVPNLVFTLEAKLPYGTHVNSRTKRILRESQALYLFVRVTPGQGVGTGTYSFAPYLRALISKVA